MNRHPGDDKTWDRALGHRPRDQRGLLAARFEEAGVSVKQVEAALDDGGDALYAAAATGDADWADAFGGPLAVALLAAEVGALAAHLNSRASAVRGRAVSDLLDEFSAVAVAAHIGVSRQKVYDIGRAGPISEYIDCAPWRQP